jgi:hypothetical protein
MKKLSPAEKCQKGMDLLTKFQMNADKQAAKDLIILYRPHSPIAKRFEAGKKARRKDVNPILLSITREVLANAQRLGIKASIDKDPQPTHEINENNEGEGSGSGSSFMSSSGSIQEMGAGDDYPITKHARNKAKDPKLEELKKHYHQKAKEAYKKASHIQQTQIIPDASDAERKAAAEQMLEHMDDAAHNYQIYDHLVEHGTMPEIPGEGEKSTDYYNNMPPKVIIKRIATLKTYISKYKDKPGHQDKYDRYMEEKAQLEVIAKAKKLID